MIKYVIIITNVFNIIMNLNNGPQGNYRGSTTFFRHYEYLKNGGLRRGRTCDFPVNSRML